MAGLSESEREQALEALKQRDPEGKRALVAELRRRGTEDAVAILVKALEDESWSLRDLAVQALAGAGESAVAPLQRLLGTGLWYTRAAAARALGKMGHAGSLPLLVSSLADSNRTVQGAALASIADLVRAGEARETARLFWAEGARQAQEWNRLLLAVHPDAGSAVSDLLADPASFLSEVRESEDEATASEPPSVRRNAS